MFGKELILDLHHCDSETFSKTSIANWFRAICEATKMKAVRQEWWEEYGNEEPHLNGVTGVQFISTSSIVVHACPDLNEIHINIFTCKDFDAEVAKKLTVEWFKGEVAAEYLLDRP